MNGYLTRLAARSLNRGEMIGPRPMSRFEKPRHAAALSGEEQVKRDRAIEPSMNQGQDLHHVALDTQVRVRSLDRTEQASAGDQPEFGSPPHSTQDKPYEYLVASRTSRDTSRLASRPDPTPRSSQIRTPFKEEEPPRHTRPRAQGYHGRTEFGMAVESDWSESHQPADAAEGRPGSGAERDEQPPHTEAYELQTGQAHRRSKVVMPASSARIIPSAGPAPSRQRTTTGLTGPQRPIIKVHIGRIDVRAIMPGPAAPKVRREQPGPSQSLQEYLSRRSGGSR